MATAACGDDDSPSMPRPPDDPPPQMGLDLDALFVEAVVEEVAAVDTQWIERNPQPTNTMLELDLPFTIADRPGHVRVVSHEMEGLKHFGMVVSVSDAPEESLPVLVYGHPGDDGVGLDELAVTLGAFGPSAADFVWVVPSFRSESVRVGQETFTSGGEPSPLDRDVDDAMAFLTAAFNVVPAAHPERIGAIGFSRGAGVALLLGIRDPRIDLVVDFSGPSDFFSPWGRSVVEDVVAGRTVGLPGVSHFYERFLRPIEEGTGSLADARIELVRRSPIFFATRLPPVQVHHGEADQVVDVAQGRTLETVLSAIGLGPPAGQFFFYPGAPHDPLQFAGAMERTAEFLGRLREPMAGGPLARRPGG